MGRSLASFVFSAVKRGPNDTSPRSFSISFSRSLASLPTSLAMRRESLPTSLANSRPSFPTNENNAFSSLTTSRSMATTSSPRVSKSFTAVTLSGACGLHELSVTTKSLNFTPTFSAIFVSSGTYSGRSVGDVE